jgi:hypothetical protein
VVTFIGGFLRVSACGVAAGVFLFMVNVPMRMIAFVDSRRSVVRMMRVRVAVHVDADGAKRQILHAIPNKAGRHSVIFFRHVRFGTRFRQQERTLRLCQDPRLKALIRCPPGAAIAVNVDLPARVSAMTQNALRFAPVRAPNPPAQKISDSWGFRPQKQFTNSARP